MRRKIKTKVRKIREKSKEVMGRSRLMKIKEYICDFGIFLLYLLQVIVNI